MRTASDVITSADHQLDLLHVNRWFERAEVKAGVEPRSLVEAKPVKMTRPGRPPETLLRFVDPARDVLREAIAFNSSEPPPSNQQRAKAYRNFRRRFRRILADPGPHPDAQRIAKELRSRLGQVFTFVRIADVPWHNNAAERAIRQGVLHRKVAGGRQTWEGAIRLHTIMSIYETCKKTGEHFLTALQRLLDPSLLRPTGGPTGPPQT